MTLEDFFTTLSNHHWFYEFEESESEWNKGHSTYETIRYLNKTPEQNAMYEDFCDYWYNVSIETLDVTHEEFLSSMKEKYFGM